MLLDTKRQLKTKIRGGQTNKKRHNFLMHDRFLLRRSRVIRAKNNNALLMPSGKNQMFLSEHLFNGSLGTQGGQVFAETARADYIPILMSVSKDTRQAHVLGKHSDFIYSYQTIRPLDSQAEGDVSIWAAVKGNS